MDIRKYFSKIPNTNQSSKAGINSKQTEKSKHVQSVPKRAKRKPILIESDSDLEEPVPVKKKKPQLVVEVEEVKIVPAVKKSKVSESNKNNEKPNKLQSISSSAYFAKNEKHVEQKQPAKNGWPDEYDDVAFEATLLDLDEFKNQEKESVEASSSVNNAKSKTNGNSSIIDAEKKIRRISSSSSDSKEKMSGNSSSIIDTKKSVPENNRRSQVKSKTPEKMTNLNTSGNDSSAKKSFWEYKNRAGPQAPGSKEIPTGEDGCLAGLTFVITGVLESIERDAASDLIKKYGGKVTQSLSKNTSFVVVGVDAGPKKLDKAHNLGTKQIDEDGLLDMIRTRKGKGKSHAILMPSQSEKAKVSLKRKKSEDLDTDEPFSQIDKMKVNFKARKTENVLEAIPGPSTQTFRTKTNIMPKKIENTPKISSGSSKSDEIKLTQLIPKTDSYSLWVEKYRPTNLKQIIGQQGDKSIVKKLLKWLLDWHRNAAGTTKKKAPSSWSDDGSGFKAALLSGPPGVGKTTSANLVCKEAGFTTVELNASDTRSKRSLHEVVSNLLSNRSLTNGMSSTSQHCLIMDEVDGMAGNEDRGGVQELIQLIKSTKVPIICLCNDRHHPKIRSLSNYCFDLRFAKPRMEQIKGAMMSICFKENLSISHKILQDLIMATQQDIRQVIHHLSLMGAKKESLAVNVKKDRKLSPFDACRKVFEAEAHKTMNIHDKTELFFNDYSIAPLFVQENYLQMKPLSAQKNALKELRLFSKTADSLCDGDLVEKSIRSQGNWGLLPVQAIYSSVVPGELLACRPSFQPNFPSWLGKNSRRGKLDRISQELALHMHLRISGNKTDVSSDYVYLLRDSIVNPLRLPDASEVGRSVAIMQAYDLLREDWDNLVELSSWPGQKDPMKGVAPKVKAAFTRTYNKSQHRIPYAVASNAKKSKNHVVDEYGTLEDDDEVEEDDDLDVSSGSMIKVNKTKTSTKEKAKKTTKTRGR